MTLLPNTYLAQFQSLRPVSPTAKPLRVSQPHTLAALLGLRQISLHGLFLIADAPGQTLTHHQNLMPNFMDPLFGSFFQGTKICLGPTTNGAHLLSESWQDFPALAGDAVRASRERLGVSSQEPLELVELLDGVSNELCQIADAAELVRNVHPEEGFSGFRVFLRIVFAKTSC